jgi:hypothetical protein
MRTKSRALTAVAVLAVLALATAALLEQRGQSSHAPSDLSPALERERVPAPPPPTVPVPPVERVSAAGEVALEDLDGAGAAAVPGTVSGRVVDGAGAPFAGAAVAVAPFERLGERLVEPLDGVLDPSAASAARGVEPDGAQHSLTTGPDGRFVLALPRAEFVRLVVRARTFAPLERTLHPGERDADGALLLGIELGDLPLQPGGVLVGSVRTRAGAPVEGAVVRRLDSFERAAAVMHAGFGDVVARTDDAGGFRVAELEPGPWKLIISAAAHPDAVFEGAEPGTAAAPLEREFVLDDGARITGRVLATAAEREGLEVRAMPLTAKASPRVAALDDDGTFQLDGLAVGASYRVGAWRRGDDPSARPRTDEVFVQGSRSGVELRFVPPTTIEFRAVDASSGDPITEFEAHLVDDRSPRLRSTLAGPDGRPALVFPDGVAVFPVLQPNAAHTVTLVVWGRHHAPRVVPGLVCTPGLSLALGDVTLQPAVTLAVTVLGADDGLPVAGAVVSIRTVGGDSPALEAVLNAPTAPIWRSARTDTNGQAILSGLPPTATTLDVLHRNFVPTRNTPVGETALATGRAEVRLEPR